MATIDLTLDSFKVPAIENYTPPFGTKIVKTDANKGGLSTVEVNSNIMMPFANMRPKVITENSTTTPIEYDAKLVFSSSLVAGVTLTLGNGGYEGCRIQISNLSRFSCDVAYSTTTVVSVPSGADVIVLWNGSSWKNKTSISVGTILTYGGSVAPLGFEICIGQTALRNDYKNLISWAIINNVIGEGKLFGAGDGSTTFVFPDLREVVLVGAGHNSTHIFDSEEINPATGTYGTQNHDEYTVGQFKDDQMQNINGKIIHVNGGNAGSATGAFTAKAGADAASAQASNRYYDFTFDSWRVARTGYDSTGTLVGSDTTHGKQVGVNYIIKI